MIKEMVWESSFNIDTICSVRVALPEESPSPNMPWLKCVQMKMGTRIINTYAKILTIIDDIDEVV